MSARDVDLEFEKAYRRLFSTSGSNAGDSGARVTAAAARQSRVLLLSEIPHTADYGSRSRLTTPSTHQVDRPKQDRSIDAGLHALSRQPSGSKQRPPPALPGQRAGSSQSKSFQSPLDALALTRQHRAPKARPARLRTWKQMSLLIAWRPSDAAPQHQLQSCHIRAAFRTRAPSLTIHTRLASHRIR